MSKDFVQLAENARSDILAVVKYRKILASKLEDFAAVRDKRDSIFEQDSNLNIEPDLEHDQIFFDYANTRIRLRLVVGIQDGAARGRVLCTHEYERSGEDQVDLLGVFLIDERGFTNFVDHVGRPYVSNSAADLIVAHYLAQALRNNMKI